MMQTERKRFTGGIDGDRTSIASHRKVLGDDGSWHPGMDTQGGEELTLR
jgi:hypothetical protein